MVLYSIEPVGTSPWPVAPMNAVIVSTGPSGSSDSVGCWPAAIRTIIVSPTMREIARTKLAMIPDTAAGTTTLVATFRRVAPSA